MGRIIFITGTDTNVGKTTLTGLLLAHALGKGEAIRALKPLSSGDRADETLLSVLQDGSVQTNFRHFDPPIAPWSAAKRSGTTLDQSELLGWLRAHREACRLLLVEGAGGLLSPLGQGFSALELIEELNAEVVVATRNRLGVLNQTLLVLSALSARRIPSMKVALIEEENPDCSAQSNFDDLVELARPTPVIRIPYLPNLKSTVSDFRAAAALLEKPLAALLGKKNPPDTEPRGFFP